jgi:hypothetical protein
VSTGSSANPTLQVAIRSEGVTPAERYLQRLCDRSFLSLWSYPGVFRDQKADGNKGDGKELCDLLVVCGDDILIFSDKSCKFPDSGDVQLDWCRWFKKAVMESARQVWGAERWLREFPDRVFLDRACKQPFPLELPCSDRMRIHHIVVAHNVSERCAAHYPGSSGTLVFNSAIQGEAHFADRDQARPFEVGWVDPDRQFVHVLDDESLGVLLTHRNTISDFLHYLRWKEALLATAKERRIRVMYCGEEDLLRIT